MDKKLVYSIQNFISLISKKKLFDLFDMTLSCNLFFTLTGYGGLSLSIEGPSKADIECLDNEDGSCRVTYKPTEPGNYIINIKFSDEHVPGKNLKHKILFSEH